MNSTKVQIFNREFEVFGYEEDGWFKNLAANNTYNEFNLENLKPLIKPDAVCLDIGANIGVMALAMATLAPMGNVYCFEGSEQTYKALIETLKASSLSNVAAIHAIVGREGECGDYIEYSNWHSSSHYRPSETGASKAKSLDSMNIKVLDFIKMDVEGGEMDVLDGAIDTLTRCKPTVVMEFNTFAMVYYREMSPRRALKRVLELFPKVQYFEGRTGALLQLDNPERFLQMNMRNGMVDDLLCSFQ